MSDALTKIESKRFIKLKARISKWCNDRFEIGAALKEIADGKLYRGSYDTFEAFCAVEYNWTRENAYKLINAVQIKKSLPANVTNLLQNPGQANALADVPEADRPAVLEAAAATGAVTAKSIEAAKEKDEPVVVDANNNPIPQDLVAEWQRAQEVGGKLRSLMQEAKNIVAAGIRDNDIIFTELLNPTISEIDALRYTLSQVIPHAICPTCKGRQRKNCTRCKKRGWYSKFSWSTFASKAEKELADKSGQRK